MKLLKYILFFAALLLLGSINSIGQQVTWSGSITQFSGQKGGTGADSMMLIPVDTTNRGAAWTPTPLRMYGRIAVKDGGFYYHNGTKWVSPTSSGGVDSATVNALISDSLSVVRDSLDNKQDKLGYEVLGFIYNKNTWNTPDTSLFYRNANVGTFMDTSVDANGDYVIVGGVNNHTSGGAVMAVKALAVFQKWSMFARFVVKNVDANSTGLAVGTTYGHMQLHTSTNVDSGGRISFWSNQFHQTLSSLAIPIAENDTVSIQITFDGYNVTGKAANYTQDTMITLEYSYINGGDLAAATVTPTYALYSLGSSNDIVIDSLSVLVNEIKNADLFVMGDSKIWRYDANSVTNCFTYRLLEHFPYSGSSGLSGLSLARFTASSINGVTISSGLDELIRLKPKQLIFELYSNTLRATSDTTTFWTDYSAIINRFQDSGIITYNLPLHETIAGMNAWKEEFFLRKLYQNYPDYIFDGIDALLDCGNCIDAAGIHPNQRGNDIIYDLIYYSGKLKNINYPPNQTWVTGNYWTLFGKIPYSQYDGAFTTATDFNAPSFTIAQVGHNKRDTIELPKLSTNIHDTLVLFEQLADTSAAIRAAIPSISGLVPSSRTITATSPIQIDGTTSADLSANRTISVLPAGAAQSGVVTTGSQTLAGQKTFSATPIFSTMTAGSLLYAGTSGILSQNNSNLFWNNSTLSFGIGTSSPNLAGWGVAQTMLSTGNVGLEAVRTTGTTVSGTNIFSFRAYSGNSTSNTAAQLAFDVMGTSQNSGRVRMSVWNAGSVANAFYINNTSNVLLNSTGTDDNTNKLQVSGSAITTQYRLSALNTPPANATDTGTTGEIRFGTDGYLYVCTATNTWIRVQLATW